MLEARLGDTLRFSPADRRIRFLCTLSGIQKLIRNETEIFVESIRGDVAVVRVTKIPIRSENPILEQDTLVANTILHAHIFFIMRNFEKIEVKD